MEEELKSNLLDIKKRIDQANPDGKKIELIAVTKTRSPKVIEAAYRLGLKNIGENKVQELLDKHETLQLELPDISWHMIGHLQRNKVRHVIGKTKLIHSLDSIRLAKELQKRSEKENLVTEVLLQINVAREESKYGLSYEDIPHFIKEIKNFQHLRVKGLMTMAPFYEEPEETRDCFKKMKELFEELKKKQEGNVLMEHLSMGMTNDFEIAIEEGANMVRLGRTLFGERK